MAERRKVMVNHEIETEVLSRYPGALKAAEVHGLENLCGIPRELNKPLHLIEMRRFWDHFYKIHLTATKEELLRAREELRRKFGSQFLPPKN